MGEPFLPWWLVLLLGMWSTALTLWRHPSVPRELCGWSGLATLIYSGLILLALVTGVPSTDSPVPTGGAPHLSVRWGLSICCMVVLATSIWIVGRTTTDSRRLCYTVLTAANAAVCALLGSPEIAVGLIFVGICSVPKEWLRHFRQPTRGSHFRFKQVFALTGPESVSHRSEETLIAGMLSIVSACLVIGTLAYSLRVETSRVATSTRYSTLPAPLIHDRLQSAVGETDHKESSLQLASGRRGDILVLLAVLAFISLAAARSELTETWFTRNSSTGDASLASQESHSHGG